MQDREEQLRILTTQLEDLHNDMATCGFNSYGVKRTTYYSWVDRSAQIVKGLQALRAESEATPPPPPVTV